MSSIWTPDGHEGSSAEDIALMQRVLRTAAQNPNLIPDEFMSYALDYMQVNRLTIPIGQISGFAQFTAQYAEVTTSDVTASLTYVDLANIGPQLTGLPDGRYVFLWSAITTCSEVNSLSHMGLNINGVDPTTLDASFAAGATTFQDFMVVGFRQSVLQNNGNNTVTAKYHTTASTGVGSTFARRRLLGLRYANI